MNTTQKQTVAQGPVVASVKTSGSVASTPVKAEPQKISAVASVPAPALPFPSRFLRNDGKEYNLISWQGPEYQNYPKDHRWYLTVGGILALIIAYAIYSNAPVMAITFILIGVVGYIYITKPPRVLDFRVTDEGIYAGRDFFDFDDAESFWIFYAPPHTQILSVKMKNAVIPHVHFPIHQVDPVKLREALLECIPEKRQKMTLLDTIERLLHI